jgi:hypothetical protein
MICSLKNLEVYFYKIMGDICDHDNNLQSNKGVRLNKR